MLVSVTVSPFQDGRQLLFVHLLFIHLPEAVLHYLGERQAGVDANTAAQCCTLVKTRRNASDFAFLGDTPSAKIEQIAAALILLLPLTANSLVCFWTRPVVFPIRDGPVFSGLGCGANWLSADHLKQAVDNALQPLGWEPERRSFKPHLTIGRIKDARKLNNTLLPLNVLLEPLRIDVDAIHLIRSDLEAERPCLHRAALESLVHAGLATRKLSRKGRIWTVSTIILYESRTAVEQSRVFGRNQDQHRPDNARSLGLVPSQPPSVVVCYPVYRRIWQCSACGALCRS